ncbi:MAG: SpoIIE family protein phosphatase [Opitutaceae bacterium]|nr:SpoIIE family protein phosphatase [Opitutaceae bacterium]
MSRVDSQVSILSLVEPAEPLDADLPLAQAQAAMVKRTEPFFGVVACGKFVGIVASSQVNQILGARFGHALFGRSPVRGHIMSTPLVVTLETPLTEVLKLASSRTDARFFEDPAVIDSDGAFVGLIPIHRLVRLQTELLLENLSQVESQRVELARRNKQMEDDLRMAREVQLAILPDGPVGLSGPGGHLRTEQYYRASESIGGDFYAFVRPNEDSLGVLVCDVMGHSVRSALITTILSALVRDASCLHEDPAQLLNRLNHHLRGVLERAGETIFVTAAYAMFSLSKREVAYAQAGHPPAIVWRKDSGRAQELVLREEAQGPALGLLDEPGYGFDRVAFGVGDSLLLYTDGIVEIADAVGEEFGLERLCRAFEAQNVGDDTGQPALLAEKADQFAGNTGFTDDVCLVVTRMSSL